MVTLVPKNDVFTEGRWILPKAKPLNVRSRSIADMVPLIGPVPDTRDSIVIMKELCLLDCFRLVLNGCDILLSHVNDLIRDTSSLDRLMRYWIKLSIIGELSTRLL